MTQYDPYGEPIAQIDGRGVSVPNTVDTTATVATLTSTAVSYTQYLAYTPQGDLQSESTPPIVTTANGVTATGPVTTSYGYDADGNQTSVTSANGNTTTYGYDHLGRPVTTTLPQAPLWDGTTTTPTEATGYDGEGNVIRQVDGNGAVTQSSYDPLGRLVAQTNPVSGTSLITYSATQKVAEQDPAGNVTTEQYDPAGRLVRTTDPSGGVTQYGYDAVGNTVAITSGDGTTATTVETRGYDAQNELVTDTVGAPGSAGQTTLTAYDGEGNVATVQQPNGDATQDFYDLADQHVETFVLPVGATAGSSDEQDAYDAAGNLSTHLDLDGRTHATLYDGADRAVQSTDVLTNATTLTTTTTFDPDGNILSQTTQTGDQTHTTTQTYNALDWLTSKTTDGVRTRYGYDALGQQLSATVANDSAPVSTVFDPQGRITALGEQVGSNTAYTSTFTYNADDLPLTITLPGLVQETGQYDSASRLLHLGATGPAAGSASLSSSYDYGYTPLGWTSTVTTTLNGGTPAAQTLSHDAQGRLTAVQGGASPQAWSYDSNGNLLTATTSGVTTTYAYNNAVSPNAVLTVTTPGQPTTYYRYDQNGDTTGITSTAGISTALSYDSQGRLSQVALADGTTVQLNYNAAGQRASYVVSMPGQPPFSETFLYRDGILGQVAVVSGTTSYTDTYLDGPNDLPLELLRTAADGTTSRYWYVLDGQSNVVALTDVSGTVVDRYAYDAWGQPTSVSERVPQPWRYAGYWYDRELGWYWLTVRSYDPALRRFLQPDPSELDGVHTYTYADDDPADTADPSGFHTGYCPGRHARWEYDKTQGVLVCRHDPIDAPDFGAFVHYSYQVFIGDDLATLGDPRANAFQKFWAFADLATNVVTLVPVDGGSIKAAELALRAKLGLSDAKDLDYVGTLTRNQADRIAQRTVPAACEACFPAGTLVATPQGTQAIQTLHVGDLVQAEDPQTGKSAAEPVQALLKDPVSPLMALDLSDGSTITVTANHSFWVDGGAWLRGAGWLQAGQLQVGDQVRTASGAAVMVTGLRRNADRAVVYTLTVAHDHTFFVGSTHVLVHNCTSIADILMPSGVLIGRTGSSAEIREVNGGLSAAQDLFTKLTKGGTEVTPLGYPGRLVELPNGGRIGLRVASRSGPPTIDVNVPGIPIKKIKFL